TVRGAPPGDGGHRMLGGAADEVLSHGLDLSSALSPGGTGLVWAAIRPGQTIARSRRFGGAAVAASVVQVTNLGITVKDSPQNTLVFVTRLDNGAPVGSASISIIRLDNTTAWSGRTDDQGIAIAPGCGSAIQLPGGTASSVLSSPRPKTATSRTSAATGTKGSSRLRSARATT